MRLVFENTAVKMRLVTANFVISHKVYLQNIPDNLVKIDKKLEDLLKILMNYMW